MKVLAKAESELADLFKAAPPLSSKAKDALAKVWPWLALVGGILQVLAAWGLWQLIDNTEEVVSYINQALGTDVGYSSSDKLFIYLSVVTLLVSGILMLMAFPKLKKGEKKGWDLIFLGALLNAVYSVFNLFIDGRGFSSFLFALIGTAIAFYLLFQVREKFKS